MKMIQKLAALESRASTKTDLLTYIYVYAAHERSHTRNTHQLVLCLRALVIGNDSSMYAELNVYIIAQSPQRL